MRVSQQTFDEIRGILQEYSDALEAAGMKEKARATAFGDVQRFACWLSRCREPMERKTSCRCGAR